MVGDELGCLFSFVSVVASKKMPSLIYREEFTEKDLPMHDVS